MRIKATNYLRHDNLHHIPSTQTNDKKLYKPSTDKKGIVCRGNNFGYVVPWEIKTNKESSILAP